MSDAIFKASLRQTQAYIDAYNPDLLRAIEADFKEALRQVHAEESESSGTEAEGEGCPSPEKAPHLHVDSEQPKAVTPDTAIRRPATAPVSQPQESASESRRAWKVLPNWHFQLPFMVAAVLAILLVFIR